ncbi:MAG: hypothetical protein IPK31_03115 [Chitinophagaceae bacterium]|nr:hypothetical protein [Chitinophagaceae bacterium]
MTSLFSTSMHNKFRLQVAGCMSNKFFLLLMLVFFFISLNFAEGQSATVNNSIEEATAADNSTFVLLQWKVKDNVSVDHYEIERMDINGSYSTIAFILSDNNEETKQYKYKDKITVRDLHLFYRIKAVNMNGTEMFSEVMPLDLKSTGDGLADVEYKNGSDFITLQLPRAKGSYIFRFYNIVGRMVKTKTISASQKKIMIGDLKMALILLKHFIRNRGRGSLRSS